MDIKNNNTVEGTKFDTDKIRMDLIDAECLMDLGRVLTYGANKYAAHNWRQGLNWSRVFAALLRHSWKFWRGEELDKETGLPHLAHAMCNAMFLLWYSKHRRAYDDRYKEPEYVADIDEKRGVSWTAVKLSDVTGTRG